MIKLFLLELNNLILNFCFFFFILIVRSINGKARKPTLDSLVVYVIFDLFLFFNEIQNILALVVDKLGQVIH